LVAVSFEAGIMSGQIKSGDQLPTETSLAAQFGVTRSTVREGIRQLEQNGLVRREGRRRLHACVPHYKGLATRLSRALVLGQVTFRQLWEAFFAIEPAMARYAAERATAEELDAMGDNLARTSAALTSRHSVVELDAEFHELLARSARSQALLLGREPVSMLFLPAVKLMMERLPQSAAQRMYVAHMHVYTAMRERNPNEAGHWMGKHIIDFQRGYALAGLEMDGAVGTSDD